MQHDLPPPAPARQALARAPRSLTGDYGQLKSGAAKNGRGAGRAWSGGIIPPGKERHTPGNGQDRDGPAGQPPSRFDRRLYFVLMTVCIGLFVLSRVVLDRHSTIAAVVVFVVALAIPPFAAIVANAASAADRRRP